MKRKRLVIGIAVSIIAVLGLGVGIWFLLLSPKGYRTPIVLKGAVITPDEVIDPGWVVVRNRRIEGVLSVNPHIPQAIEIDTGGLIFPGLINLHDHVVWNIIPRWDPGQVFLNRYEWRMGSEENEANKKAVNEMTSDYFCQMNSFGEVRSLVGGTTTIIGTGRNVCIRGFVRNLDFWSGFYPLPILQDHRHIRNVIDLPTDGRKIGQFLSSQQSEAFFIHLAEGVGPAMRAEFEQLDEQDLLTDKTVIIHGVALSPEQFRRMKEQGAALIWSPRSNLELYGQTADIASAIEAGVTIAIGPDWGITGSANLLDELHVADAWNSIYLDGLLSDRQLVEMVTTIPAAIAGISEEVGSIEEGKFADLLVISGDTSQPYRALLDAEPEQIQLVLVDGSPVYGDIPFMERFWDPADLSHIDISGTVKALRMSNFDEMAADLGLALSDYGFDLAPIAEEGEIDLSGMVIDLPVVAVPENTTGEISWDQAVYFFGETMTVCGPVVDIHDSSPDNRIPSNLYLGRPYPDIDRFTVYIPQHAAKSFTDLSEDFLYHNICVSGEILVYQGTAEIVVTHPEQITRP